MSLSFIQHYRESLSGLSREVWLLSAITFVNRIGSMVLPFLTLYLTESLGWTMSAAAYVGLCYGGGSFAGSFIGGWLVDKIGPYRVIFFSLLTSGLGFYGFLISTDFWFLCVWTLVVVTLADALRPASMAAIRIFSKEENVTRSISLLRMAINLGVAIGPAIGGVIIAVFGYNWIFIIEGATCVMAAFFLKASLKPKRAYVSEVTPKSTYIVYGDFPFLLFMFANVLNLVAFFQILQAVPQFLTNVHGFSEGYIGLFFFFNGFLIFLLEMPIVHYLDKNYHPVKSMIAGAFLIGVAHLFLLSENTVLFSIGLYSILVAIGEIINFPFIGSIAMKRSPKNATGSYMGVVTMMFSLTFAITPILGLNLAEQYGYKITWLVMVGLCAVSMLCFYFLKDKIVLKVETKE